MEQNINFLKDRIAVLKKKSRKLFFIQSWSVGLMVVYGVLVLSSFSYSIILKNQNQDLKEKIQKEEKVIEGLRPIETKQVYLASKIKSLSKILVSKRQHQEIVESLFYILPEGISVSNFNMSEDGKVSFSGSCTSLRVLKNFLDILEAQGRISEMMIKEAQIGSVSYGFEREYHFNVSLMFYLGRE